MYVIYADTFHMCLHVAKNGACDFIKLVTLGHLSIHTLLGEVVYNKETYT
jgi:hypothetical protein